MNREEALDFVDRVFFGMNALVIKMSKLSDIAPDGWSLDLEKLPPEYEEVRQYIKENLK